MLKEFYRNNNLKIIFNSVHNPKFAPIELAFNKLKNGTRQKYYHTE